MLIKRLKATNNPATQAAIVSAARAELRSWILTQVSPNKLAMRASKIKAVSTQHPAAASLAKEAALAIERATSINEKAEVAAISVMEGGKAFFKRHGLRVSNRLNYMYQKRGSWTEVHAQLVRIGAGEKNFKLLCEAGQIELTSEWFIATYAPYAVDTELLAEIRELLTGATNDAHTLKAAA
jgi:hypothetical protein